MNLNALLLLSGVVFVCVLPSSARYHPGEKELLEFESAGAAKIYRNYRAPTLEQKKLDLVRALVLFLLQPDGRVTNVTAVRQSGALKAIGLRKESDFLALEKALVRAIKSSSPLPKPPAEPQLANVAHEVLYVFEPSKNATGTLTLLPLPMVPVKR